MLMSETLERALRWAAACHRGQTRKGGDIPYFEHAAAVALILHRLGCDEDVVVAGALHDVVEDTDATLDDVRARFGPDVARTVALCSETKHDDHGAKRPWLVRKTEYLDRLAASGSTAAKAVALADKLHNLVCIACDLRDGVDLWSRFNADQHQALWYYRAAIDACGVGDPNLETLATECRRMLAEVEAVVTGEPPPLASYGERKEKGTEGINKG